MTTAANWVSLSSTGGTLESGNGATIHTTINSNANALSAGSYVATLIFYQDGEIVTTRTITLLLTDAPGALSVEDTIWSETFAQADQLNGTVEVFTLTNSGGNDIDWTASKSETWLSLSATAGTVGPFNTTTFSAILNRNADLLASGTYTDTIVVSDTTNNQSTEIFVTIVIADTDPGLLSVTGEDFVANGAVGGPFNYVSNRNYTVSNIGGETIAWSVLSSANWLSFDVSQGSLERSSSSRNTNTILVRLNQNANKLTAGTYTGTVAFYANGLEVIEYSSVLTVLEGVGVMTVESDEGNPWIVDPVIIGTAPGDIENIYTISNVGPSAITWNAAKNQNWLDLSVTGGALAPLTGITQITATLNGNVRTLAAGVYTATIAFTNVTTGNGDTTAYVNLVVSPATPGNLSVNNPEPVYVTGPIGGPLVPDRIDYLLAWVSSSATICKSPVSSRIHFAFLRKSFLPDW